MTVVRFQNFADEGATGQVWVRDTAHAMGGQWGAYEAFPIGSIFISVVATDPATLLGYGTWSAFGGGRVLLGNDGGTYPTDEATGGATSTTHSHGPGTLTTDTYGGHAHGAGTLAPSAHSGTAVASHNWGTDLLHQHFAGTLAPSAHTGTAVDSHPSHYHQYSTVPAHSHPITGSKFAHGHNIASGQGSHDHTVPTGDTDNAGGYAADRSTYNSTNSVTTNTQTLPAMTADSANLPNNDTEATGTSGALDTTGPYASGSATTLTHTVTQPATHTMSGNTGNVASTEDPIVHSVTQPSNHTMSGSTANDGAHSHSVNSGATASDATSVMQPYIVCHFWKRIA